MKTKFILVGALALSMLMACKIDKKYERGEAPAPAKQQGTGRVSVILKAVVKKDDSFQLFYTEDGTLNYNGEQSAIVPVTGNENVQDIVFSFPDEALPSTLRLDIGENREQGEIKVEGLTVIYYDKKLEISGKDFLKYFQPNNNMKPNEQTQVIKLEPASDGVYDPMFYPSGDLINALKTVLVK